MSPTPLHAPRRRRRHRLAAASLVLAAALTATAASATAASAATGKNVLNISMQQQENTNWCWSASGNTIASWFGYKYTQTQFCNAAFNRPQGSSCPNNQATLEDDQTAFRWMGLSSGTVTSSAISYSSVQRQIDAQQPMMARIQWSSGGGHAEVLYGYDASKSWVYWGDPWPDDTRYNWATYDYYRSNSDFSWTHTLYGIGA
ncbi:conserved hypothetical protein [Streptomyces sp. e14]|uniref:papain-like cysteine protease family protein n=1 Tax=unclassified Streptomyces TaxID=2593676 RepID=UPI0001D06D6F|nr:papain-like cysteine protease family protein [Streptomyces sp. e14]EFF88224.1 conserved hypothetical protein [Streptomyces sp. e14]MYS46573.1 hypothetical protein [Streptomyces sp. SID5998]NED78088.1 hypothetical protein [Streptomyces sp. SID9944]